MGAHAQSSVRLAADAPDSYTVRSGDTLWGISGRFLQEPWRWPEVWRLNRDEIRNPHLIYPGQVILLDRSGPWLSVGRRVGGGSTVDSRLQPKVYNEPITEALPSIPLQIIEPFLNRPLVVDQPRLDGSATIVATETSRVLTVPNSALRFNPQAVVKNTGSKSVLSRMMPGPPRSNAPKTAKVDERPGARQLWVLKDGQPQPLPVTTGITDGRMTEVSGEGLSEGLPIITDQRNNGGKP